MALIVALKFSLTTSTKSVYLPTVYVTKTNYIFMKYVVQKSSSFFLTTFLIDIAIYQKSIRTQRRTSNVLHRKKTPAAKCKLSKSHRCHFALNNKWTYAKTFANLTSQVFCLNTLLVRVVVNTHNDNRPDEIMQNINNLLQEFFESSTMCPQSSPPPPPPRRRRARWIRKRYADVIWTQLFEKYTVHVDETKNLQSRWRS